MSNVIAKLPDDVIGKIAAGEVIHNVRFAIKELIENSIDANATLISIIVSMLSNSPFGTRFLQISDNGDGISKESLPLLCARFSTSKFVPTKENQLDYGNMDLTNSLSELTTFGFRGEALASISSVSTRITVVSKTNQCEHAYKAEYEEGALREEHGIKMCSGNNGTTITIFNILHNYIHRSTALLKNYEILNQTIEMLQNFSMHYPTIGFVLKKQTSNQEIFSYIPTNMALNNSNNPTSNINNSYNSNIGDNNNRVALQAITIKELFGIKLSNQVISISYTKDDSNSDAPTDLLSVEGLITSSNYGISKKRDFSFWINNRPITHSLLTKTLNNIYSSFLPKKLVFPFVYLSMHIHPSAIDVNYHTQKLEVCLQNDTEIFKFITEHLIMPILINSSKTKSLLSQSSLLFDTKLSQPNSPNDSLISRVENIQPTSPVRKLSRNQVGDPLQENLEVSHASLPAPIKVYNTPQKPLYDHQYIRTDKNAQSIHQFFNKFNVNASQSQSQSQSLSRTPLANSNRKSMSSHDMHVPPVNSILKEPVKNDLLVKPSMLQQQLIIYEGSDDDRTITATTKESPKLTDVTSNPLLKPLTDPPAVQLSLAIISNDVIKRKLQRLITLLSSNNKRDVIRDSILVSIDIIYQPHEKKDIIWLFQHATDLYIGNLTHITTDYFYQIIISNLGYLPLLKLSDTLGNQFLPLKEIILSTLNNTSMSGFNPNKMKMSTNSLADEITNLIVSKSEFLKTYFNIRINCANNMDCSPQCMHEKIITHIPMLVINPGVFMSFIGTFNNVNNNKITEPKSMHTHFYPNIKYLGLALIRIATECAWDSVIDNNELVGDCNGAVLIVHQVALELAKFYSIHPDQYDLLSTDCENTIEEVHWILRHAYVPELVRNYTPSYILYYFYNEGCKPLFDNTICPYPNGLTSALKVGLDYITNPIDYSQNKENTLNQLLYYTNKDNAIRKISSLPGLYKIFERC